MNLTYQEIGKFFEKFAETINASFSIYDENLNLQYKTEHNRSKLCKILESNSISLCKEFLKENFKKAKKEKVIFTIKCPVGHLVFVVPLIIKNEFKGILTGSVGIVSFSKRRRENIKKVANLLQISEKKLLKLAEEEFLYTKFISQNNPNIFFRDIRNKACIKSLLKTFLKTLKIVNSYKSIKPNCCFTDKLINEIVSLIAGNYTPSNKVFYTPTNEEDVIFTLLELAKDTSRNLLKIATSESLKWKAYHDSLTGVYNRHVLEEEIRKIKDLRIVPVAFILVDIDDLKIINDTYGHDMGDKAIFAVAKAIKSAVRRSDIVVRMGGDEFIVLLPGIGKEEVEKIVRRIEKNIPKQQEIMKLPFELKVSIGYETCLRPENVEDAILQADRRMYLCKREKKCPENFKLKRLNNQNNSNNKPSAD